MNILIANVRNLESCQLKVLAGELAKKHSVTVCSLEGSARQKGNAFSCNGLPTKFKQISNYTVNGNTRIPAYKFQGTPADMISASDLKSDNPPRSLKEQTALLQVMNGTSLSAHFTTLTTNTIFVSLITKKEMYIRFSPIILQNFMTQRR